MQWDGGEHDEREDPPLRERHREAAEECDEQLDELADLPAHGVLDEHRVTDIRLMTSPLLVCWLKKPTWSKGSTASSTTRGVRPGLRSLEELRAAALEQQLGSTLACWRRGERGLRPWRREPLAALLVCPKGEVMGGDKEEAAP
jgi:hypothetical protein